MLPALAIALALLTPQASYDTVWVTGTVVCTDDRGVEHRDWDGVLTVYLAETDEEVSIDVVRGCWSAWLPRDAEVEVAEMKLGGRWCILPEWRLPKEEPIELRAAWQCQPRLRVFDLATGRELSRVTAFAEFCSPMPCGPTPYAARLAEQRDAPSPVPTELDPPDWEPRQWKTYWVGAPGYAWKAVEVDHGRPDDVPVFLTRERGSIEVVVAREEHQFATVMLARIEGGSMQSYGRRDEPFTDLPAGSYVVTVHAHGSRAERRELELRSGETVRVIVPLPSPPPPAHGTLELRVDGPDGLESVNTWLRSLDSDFVQRPPRPSATERDGRSLVLRWDEMPVGRVEVQAGTAQRVTGTRWTGTAQVDVRPNVTTRAAMTLTAAPPPLALRLLDATTGRAPEGQPFLVRRDPWGSTTLTFLRPGREPGTREVWPGGEACGEVRVPGFLPAPVDVSRIAPGALLDVPLRPAATLAVRMLDGERPALVQSASVGTGWRRHATTIVRLTPLDGSAARVVHGWTARYEPLQVLADRSGRYLLEVEAPPGYAPVAPFEVELRVGETTDVVVELVRTF